MSLVSPTALSLAGADARDARGRGREGTAGAAGAAGTEGLRGPRGTRGTRGGGWGGAGFRGAPAGRSGEWRGAAAEAGDGAHAWSRSSCSSLRAGRAGAAEDPDAEAPGIDEIVAKQLREEEAQSFLRLARDAMHSDGGSVLPSLEHLRQAAGTNSGGPAQAKALFLLAVMELNRATGGARAFAPGTSAHGSSRNTIGIAPELDAGASSPSLRIRAPAAATQEEKQIARNASRAHGGKSSIHSAQSAESEF